ncbi:hypothetical protein DA2_3515 [Desulfovibrio sp. A2]|nr:hypothetical protein DA2_3515 [Desulfovibrio sp. A2]
MPASRPFLAPFPPLFRPCRRAPKAFKPARAAAGAAFTPPPWPLRSCGLALTAVDQHRHGPIHGGTDHAPRPTHLTGRMPAPATRSPQEAP